jgi:hypothetical protein
MSNPLTREAFLGLRGRPQEIYVPEWNATVHLRVMSPIERLAWIEFMDSAGDKDPRCAGALLVRCLCDAHGARILGDGEEDVAAVMEKESVVVDRLAELALRLNGMGEEAQAELAKNSGTGQG